MKKKPSPKSESKEVPKLNSPDEGMPAEEFDEILKKVSRKLDSGEQEPKEK